MAPWPALQQRQLGLAALGTVLFTVGCTVGPRVLPTPAPTATGAILADCFWAADVLAWIDVNGNGARDEGELPLEGVQANFSLTFYSGGTTGPDGTAHVGGMHPGECDWSLPHKVIAQVPEGYEPTTATTLPYTETQDVYEFGFKPNPE